MQWQYHQNSFNKTPRPDPANILHHTNWGKPVQHNINTDLHKNTINMITNNSIDQNNNSDEMIENLLDLGQKSINTNNTFRTNNRFLRLEEILEEGENSDKDSDINNLTKITQNTETETEAETKINTDYPFKILIQTTEILSDIADALSKHFSEYGISCTILNSDEIQTSILNDTIDSPNFYLLLYTANMKIIPTMSPYCIFNLEQYKIWKDVFPYCHHNTTIRQRMKIAMENSSFIFDYANENIDHYPDDIKDKVLFFPLPLPSTKVTNITNPRPRVVFVGQGTKRRQKIIKSLLDENGIKIDIINANKPCVGKELYDELKKATVILNLHSQFDSILETARINTALRVSNAIIISEDVDNKEMQNIYKNVVTFVPTIKDDMSNIGPLIKNILMGLVSNTNDLDYLNERHKQSMSIWGKLNIMDKGTPILLNPYIFHKYFLKISKPHTNILYTDMNSNFQFDIENKSIAHLHCRHLNNFHKIFNDYIPIIHEQFQIIITYCEGSTREISAPFTLLKVSNKGDHIGAQFTIIKYLNDIGSNYERILFLHDYPEIERRNLLFQQLLTGVNKTHMRKMAHIEWETKGDYTRSLNGYYNGAWLPERNLLYRKELGKLIYGKEITDGTFVEGNIFLIPRNEAEKIYGDITIYNVLNSPEDFDYNWCCKRYSLDGTFNSVYEKFCRERLPASDNYNIDGYIEQTFQRLVPPGDSSLATSEQNAKNNYREICLEGLKIYKNIKLHNFGKQYTPKNSSCFYETKETVLIEYRELPHIEYLIRRMIHLLPNDWNHTIICGLDNHIMVQRICNEIHKDLDSKIRVILTPICKSINDYNNMLLTESFWSQLKSEKILLYQEDTCLFHNNIDGFLHYDYIGAPWPKHQDENLYQVGNGGFSLRTRSKMLTCLQTIHPLSVQLEKGAEQIRLNVGLQQPAEDVYFSKVMIDYNLGKVAKWDIAKKFSQETQKSPNPLGGHCFWIANHDDIYKAVPKRYLINSDYYLNADHRCGWKPTILQAINSNTLIKPTSNTKIYDSDINLVDGMDQIWSPWTVDSQGGVPTKMTKPWIGIIHYMLDIPAHIGFQSAGIILMNAKSSFEHCKGIVTLSNTCKEQITKFMSQIGYGDIPIHTIKHPMGKLEGRFSLKNFQENKKTRLIIQVGMQYRKVTTIYHLKTSYDKMWLPGQVNKAIMCAELEWSKDLKQKKPLPINDVHILRTQTIQEYDELLLNNIVIIPVWTASANNAVLECMVMNIPAFVTRTPGTEEYLGKNYPMFFNEIEELERIINNEKQLLKLYEITNKYLIKLDKTDIQYEHFNSELLKLIN